jgi:carotenoid cleavage dioxygenase-like enzyme
MRAAIRATWVLGLLAGPVASAGAMASLGTPGSLASLASPAMLIFVLPALMPFGVLVFVARRAAEQPGNERAATAATWLAALGLSAASFGSCWTVATVHGTGSQFNSLLLILNPSLFCGAVPVLFPLCLWLSRLFDDGAADGNGVVESRPAELPLTGPMLPADPAPTAFPRGVFRSLPDELDDRLASVRGALPDWLRGDLVRTAPALFASGDWRAAHWFDGLCLIYAFRLGEGGVRYAQQPLDSDVRRRLAAGFDDTPSFGTPMRRGLGRLLQPVPRPNDNANVSCLPLGGELTALTEGPLQHRIDRATLRSTGHVAYADGLGDTLLMLAHPHADFVKGTAVNVATELGVRSGLLLYEQPRDAPRRTLVARVPLAEVPYLHSFGLTARHAVLLAGPFLVRAASLLWSERGYIDHFRFHPERGTVLYRIDRGSGTVATHRAPAMFVFHTLNTFEREGETVHDVLAYDDASIVARLSTARLVEGFPDVRARPLRLTLRHGVEEARVESLADVSFEFPAIPYRRCSGSDYGVAWGAASGPTGGAYRSELVRLELASGKVARLAEGDFVFGEPVFVPRPGATREGEGVLLSVASHPTDARAALAVVDAETLDVRAWAETDVPIPLGFHGSFLRAGEEAKPA